MTSSDLQLFHSDMVSNLKKKGEAILQDITPVTADLLHMAVGLSGEVAELTECFLPALNDAQPIDRTNFIEEMGDIEFYAEGIRQILALERTDVTSRLVPELLPRKVITNMVVQAGAILDYAKKASIYAKTIDVSSIALQLALLEIGMENLRRIMNVSRDECLTANMDKLGKRYPNFEYTNVRAQERADKQ